MKTFKITYWKNGELYYLIHEGINLETVQKQFGTPDVVSIRELTGMEREIEETRRRVQGYGFPFFNRDGLD